MQLRSRGSLWQYKKDTDKALADYDEAIRLNPSDVTSLLNRANLLAQKEELDRASADCEQSLRLSPSLAQSYVIRAWVLYKKQDYNKAIADLTRVLDRDPKNACAPRTVLPHNSTASESLARRWRTMSNSPDRIQKIQHPGIQAAWIRATSPDPRTATDPRGHPGHRGVQAHRLGRSGQPGHAGRGSCRGGQVRRGRNLAAAGQQSAHQR